MFCVGSEHRASGPIQVQPIFRSGSVLARNHEVSVTGGAQLHGKCASGARTNMISDAQSEGLHANDI